MGSRLGLMRAALIVWASGTVASAVLALLVSPTGWAFIAGSTRHIDERWGYAATFVLLDALLAAVGVTIAVWLLGFRLSYATAVLVLAVGEGFALVVTQVLFTQATTDPTGIGVPALTTGLWPLRALLGMLVPAYLINAIASRPERHSTTASA
jgi:hypothetical protein